MKKWLLAVLTVLMVLLAACAAAEGEVRIMVASDLHYLAPSLYEGSDFFIEAISQGDGKATMYSGEMLAALAEEARHQQPDLLVLSGDLIFNGERLSHEELAAPCVRSRRRASPWS